MPQSFMKNRLLGSLVCFAVIYAPSQAFSQISAQAYLDGLHHSADTVQYRLSTSVLNDSTLFNYEIGAITIHSGSGVKYLHFLDSSFGPIGMGFYRTQPFITSSHSDSISFYRFAYFDDKSKQSVAIDGKDTAFIDSVTASWFSALTSGGGKTVIPDTNYFDKNSSILYILSLHSSSTDSLLTIVDTVRCWTSSTTHHLYYATTGNTPSLRKLASPIDSGVTAYFDVAIVTNLKPGATLATSGEVMNRQRGSTRETYGSFQRKPKVNGPSPKVSGNNAVSYHFTLRASPNPTTRLLHATLQSEVATSVKLELITSNGGIVYAFQKDLIVGRNEVEIPVATLSAGVYVLKVTSEHASLGDVKILVLH